MIDPMVMGYCVHATYRDMLRKQRFAPVGDPFFQMNKETWEYWGTVMNKKRAETGDNGVSDSKAIGW